MKKLFLFFGLPVNLLLVAFTGIAFYEEIILTIIEQKQQSPGLGFIHGAYPISMPLVLFLWFSPLFSMLWILISGIVLFVRRKTIKTDKYIRWVCVLFIISIICLLYLFIPYYEFKYMIISKFW